MDVNQACGYSGEVALCAAASQGQLGSCQILIKTGKADVNLINEKNGNSPLFIAVKEGHYAIVDLLLNNGASLERYVGIFLFDTHNLKVQVFWEGHKNLVLSSSRFGNY